jgi:NAD(P) transhydrogenase subunit alpha
MAGEASTLYARNVAALAGLLVTDGAVRVDDGDEVVAGALLTRDGEVVSPRARGALGLPEVAS